MEWAAAGILLLLMGCLMTQGACGAQGSLQSLTHDIDLGAVALITQIRSGLGAANVAERRWKGCCAELPGGRTARRGDAACLSAGGRRKVCQARRFVLQKGDRVDTSGRCSWLAYSPAQLQRRSAHVQRLAKLCGQTDSEHGGLPSVGRYQLKTTICLCLVEALSSYFETRHRSQCQLEVIGRHKGQQFNANEGWALSCCNGLRELSLASLSLCFAGLLGHHRAAGFSSRVTRR